jgi:hypothetical protein
VTYDQRHEPMSSDVWQHRAGAVDGEVPVAGA